jgi:hypothetical protein
MEMAFAEINPASWKINRLTGEALEKLAGEAGA